MTDFTGIDPEMPEQTEPKTVPLVIYKDGQRKIIGEATVNGNEIVGRVSGEFSELIIPKMIDGPAFFSMGPAPFDAETKTEISAIVMDRRDWDPNIDLEKDK